MKLNISMKILMFKNAQERLNSKELVQKVQIKESIKVYKKLFDSD